MYQVPIISFIIPVYNVKIYIDKCLECLINNWDGTYEIILINDGSTDGSKEICEQYALMYNFIKHINQNNKGLSVARNIGILNSLGLYLAFLDSDDFVNEAVFKELVSFIRNARNVDIILGRSLDYYEENNTYEEKNTYKKIKHRNSPSDVFNDLEKINKFTFAAWLLIVRRSFIIDNNLFFCKGIFHEDELWVPQVISKGDSIAIFDKPFYCYRKGRKDSIVNQRDIKKQFDRVFIMDTLESESQKLIGSPKRLFKNRISALEWGLLINYKLYQYYDDDKKLEKQILQRVKYLNHGKYTLIYYLIKIIGKKRFLELVKHISV